MGDKSPRSNDRKKKQAKTTKDQKSVAAHTKANPAPVMPFTNKKKGK